MNAIALLTLLLQYSDKIVAIGQLLSKAQTEGRDVTSQELDVLFGQDDAARARLEALIAARTQPPAPV
jgi:hypothetical protein